METGKRVKGRKIMDYATWEKYKVELANELWIPFGKWPTGVQEAMREIESEARMFLEASGKWISRPLGLQPGMAYRVNPAWPGPAKPEPVAEYEDVPVDCNHLGRHHYMYARDGEAICSIAFALADPRFAGYVMSDGLLAPCLIFDEEPDGTYRLRVPKAVRLRKEVA